MLIKHEGTMRSGMTLMNVAKSEKDIARIREKHNDNFNLEDMKIIECKMGSGMTLMNVALIDKISRSYPKQKIISNYKLASYAKETKQK